MSPGCAGRFCPPLSLFPSPQHIMQLFSPTCLVSGLSRNSPLSLFHPLPLSFFRCLFILFTCFHSYVQQQRLGCFLGDGRWTHTWTGCKDFPNQGLFDLLMHMQSECMFSRCGSLRPRVPGRGSSSFLPEETQASSFQLKSASAFVRRCTAADQTRFHLFTAVLVSSMS